jgi:hypothetical protein
MLAAGLGQALDAIGPIGAAAEQPRDHQSGLSDLLHIQVDRQVVAEPHDRGESQGGSSRVVAAESRLGRREQGDLGIGARQHDDVTRGLGKIDRARAVGDHPGFGGEQMHSVARR